MIDVYNQKNQKSSRKPKPRKGGNGRPKDSMKGEREDDRNINVKCSDNINNPNYYFTDETLKNQIGTVSFNQFTGVAFPMGVALNGTQLTKMGSTIMRINLNPSAGFTRGVGVQNSSNLAALSLYTKLSANNAKTSQYGPQDLTTMILAMGEVIALSSHIARAFGVARLFNFRNRSYPKHVITAMGVDYDDLIANFSDYRSRYNLTMVSASQIPIPANIPYFLKARELFSGIYLDMEGSAMAQTYLFSPATSWYLDETAEGGTALRSLSITTQGDSVIKMNQLLGYLDSAIQELLQSTTLNAIYSDVLRVSEKEGLPLYTFTTISDDYTVLPSYNPEIRKWINNLTVMGRPLVTPEAGYTPGNDVIPDPNTNSIVYKPQFQVLATFAPNPIINFDTGNATVDDVIEATRLTSSFTIKNGDSGVVTDQVALPDRYVTEIITYEAGTASGKIDHIGLRYVDDNDASVLYNAMTTIANLSNFDWAPTIYLVNQNYDLYEILQDLNYYTTLDFEYLSKLQDTIFFGLLSIR